MAVNVLVPLLIPLGEQLTNVTKLVGSDPVEFDQPEYEVQVPENTNHQLLLTLTAKVNIQGTHVEYRIVEGNKDANFHLNPSSGILSLRKPLDYELHKEYWLVVEARSGDVSGEARVLINVLDVNDHAPMFLRHLHETQITEEDNRHLPKVILKEVIAVDGDGGEHGELKYKISGDGIYTNGSRSCFSFDPQTGTVLLLRPLDRDPPNGMAQWRLRVSASDGELNTYTDIRVNLKDTNDNTPYFYNDTIYATITENIPIGTSVVVVSAIDNDDPHEGDNAKITYSLEKNAIDEITGSAIFNINSTSGLITTALCCLDREETHRYAIQVVATDGGGLKGSGTVVVDVMDINDVAPMFSRQKWTFDVLESIIPHQVLATLTVLDHDVTNNFAFRIVAGSGDGWQMFDIKTRDDGISGGDLMAIQPLDYEDPNHRTGFHFRVQVTDLGDEGWNEISHISESHVQINLIDVNDNDPVFSRDITHLSLPEDTQPGVCITTFTALDPDVGGEGSVQYSIAEDSDPRRQFGVDNGGAVTLVGGLDRETLPTHTVLVLALDQGTPSRTATATLRINVTDVNDNPPYIAEPQEVHVMENSKPQVVARVKLGDPDDWSQGHGPPFTITLDPKAPTHITGSVRVTLDKKGDDGRGVGVVWTTKSLDREDRRALLVPVVVADGGWPSLSATVTLTIHVTDVNDNPMLPATKTVTLYTLQRGGGVDVPIGRIYVNDPDDWDVTSKIYTWRQQKHSGFNLDTNTGNITMTPTTPDGRYDLEFMVSDSIQEQKNIEANVTVYVESLTKNQVISATPITIAAHPNSVITQHTKSGSSILTRLMAAVGKWVDDDDGGGSVIPVSIQPIHIHTSTSSSTSTLTRVWISSVGVTNLDHILIYHKEEVIDSIGVAISDIGQVTCSNENNEGLIHGLASCVGGCWMWMSDVYNVIDANTSAVVSPNVIIGAKCTCLTDKQQQLQQQQQQNTHCTFNTCLNGGKCIQTSSGVKCICPDGTWGSRCKVLMRHFDGDGGGWAWVPPIPPCTELHMSMEVLTQSGEATLLYSGVSERMSHQDVINDHIMLHLQQGRPYLLLDLADGQVTLDINTSYSLADNTWHRIDIIWKQQVVELVVDLCSWVNTNNTSIINTQQHNDTTPPTTTPINTCQGSATLPKTTHVLNTGSVLQVGGVARPSNTHTHSTSHTPHLRGCIRNLRVNGQVVDLGKGIVSGYSHPGCPATDCHFNGIHCGLHARCEGSPGFLRCVCEPGWSGTECHTPTIPTTFIPNNSYIKLALSFTPLPYTTSIMLRFRTWRRRGELIMLSSQHGRDMWWVQIVDGSVCTMLKLHTQTKSSLCLTRATLTDGRWHYLRTTRFGSSMVLWVDDGDGDLYNATIQTEGLKVLEVDKQEGVHLASSPDSRQKTASKTNTDFDGCMDDVRISGHSIPLPPTVNNSVWGQATTFNGVQSGCNAPSVCINVSCQHPFTCVDTWRSYHCGCGEGRVLSDNNAICEDEDECIWKPCLNGGTCFNTQPGFVCMCPMGLSGEYCHIPDMAQTSLKLSLGVLVTIVAWCIFLILLICAFLLHQHHCRSAGVCKNMSDVKGSTVNCKDERSPQHNHTPNLLELQIQKLPRANGQPDWVKNINIADVDVLQVDGSSLPRSLEKSDECGLSISASPGRRKHSIHSINSKKSDECVVMTASPGSHKHSINGKKRGPSVISQDDLRNYQYEGEGSSPGSLSSCLESCSGSGKFLGGFREVAQMVES